MIHFAGLKAVGESVENPMRYFDNNLIGSITLYKVMAKYGCKKVCFWYLLDTELVWFIAILDSRFIWIVF